jgi:hypothetical protein
MQETATVQPTVIRAMEMRWRHPRFKRLPCELADAISRKRPRVGPAAAYITFFRNFMPIAHLLKRSFILP